jgi:hypothetical protein
VSGKFAGALGIIEQGHLFGQQPCAVAVRAILSRDRVIHSLKPDELQPVAGSQRYLVEVTPIAPAA